jgi:hypothetical protein
VLRKWQARFGEGPTEKYLHGNSLAAYSTHYAFYHRPFCQPSLEGFEVILVQSKLRTLPCPIICLTNGRMLLAKSTMVVIHELGKRNNQECLPFSWVEMGSVNGFGLLKRVRLLCQYRVRHFFPRNSVEWAAKEESNVSRTSSANNDERTSNQDPA